MTDDRIAFRELLEKGSDATFLREMIGFAAQRLMELEAEGLCGAAHGERSPERANRRNGYRERDWEPRAEAVELRIPKLRDDRAPARRRAPLWGESGHESGHKSRGHQRPTRGRLGAGRPRGAAIDAPSYTVTL